MIHNDATWFWWFWFYFRTFVDFFDFFLIFFWSIDEWINFNKKTCVNVKKIIFISRRRNEKNVFEKFFHSRFQFQFSFFVDDLMNFKMMKWINKKIYIYWMFNNSLKSKLMLSMHLSFEQQINTHLSKIFTNTTNQIWLLCFEKSRLRDKFVYIKHSKSQSFFDVLRVIFRIWKNVIATIEMFFSWKIRRVFVIRMTIIAIIVVVVAFDFFFIVFVLNVFLNIVLNKKQFFENHKTI